MDNHTHKHTIFWADDDMDDRMLFREVLETHAPDHRVVEFSNGQELIQALQQTPVHEHPCLIVLDMNMPVFSGRETLPLIKANATLQRIPVVIFTTSASPLDKHFCNRFQTEMITKPASLESLEQVVARFVGMCGSTHKEKQAA